MYYVKHLQNKCTIFANIYQVSSGGISTIGEVCTILRASNGKVADGSDSDW
jgi:hypothetical protein